MAESVEELKNLMESGVTIAETEENLRHSIEFAKTELRNNDTMWHASDGDRRLREAWLKEFIAEHEGKLEILVSNIGLHKWLKV